MVSVNNPLLPETSCPELLVLPLFPATDTFLAAKDKINRFMTRLRHTGDGGIVCLDDDDHPWC